MNVTARFSRTKAPWAAAFLTIAVFQAEAASPWRFWTKADGLTESVAFGLTADAAGRIIAKPGNVGSLSILDGYRIATLPVPHTYGRILASSNGELWTFDANGIEVHDASGWRAYPETDLLEFSKERAMSRTPWYTYSVFRDPKERMDIVPAGNETAVLLFPDRLVEWNRTTGSRRTIRRAAQTGLTEFLDIEKASDGSLLVTGESAIGKLRIEGSRFDWVETPGPAGYTDFVYPSESQATNTKDGELVVSATRRDGKHAVLSDRNGQWKEVYVAEDFASLLRGWRGPGNSLWIQNDRKIVEFDAAGRVMDPNEGKAIAGLTTAVLSEPDQSFWLATTAGVARYSLAIWRTPPEAAWVDDAVSAIAEDRRGRVWFVAGRYLLSEENGQWRRFRMPAGTGQPALTDIAVTLENGDVGILANFLSGLLIFHPSSGRFEIAAPPEGQRVGWIAKRRQGGLWVEILRENGDGCALAVFENGKFVRSGLPDIGAFSDLKAVLETKSGDIWLGATNLAGRIRNGRIQTFRPKDGFTDTGVFSLLETADGHVLLGGRENITEYDGGNFHKVHAIDLAESLAMDRDGTLWVASGSGIHRYKPGQWITNNVEEGLSVSEVRKIFIDSRGRVWTGTGRGIDLYHPHADVDPPVTRIIDDRNLRVTPPDGKVRLTFTGMDKWKFTPSERLLFSWRIDESPWSEFVSTDFASFEGLKAGSHRFEARAMDRNGNVDPRPAVYEFSVLLPWYKQTSFVFLAGIAGIVIAALARMVWRHHELLKYEGGHDSLTGLANRRAFDARLQEAITEARATDSTVAIMLLDLDRFKPINDTLGHAIGDLFLKEVSARLRGAIREHDMLARLGGDEFAIVMPQLRDRGEAETAARKLLAILRQPYFIESFELSGSASVGVSLFPEHAQDTATLKRLADMAMYQCKAENKDEYVIFDGRSVAVDFHAARVAALIRESLERRFFQLHYQPIRDITGRLVGFEALIRLDHPSLGLLPPDDFIGIAEHTGLIVRVGSWVLEEACRQMARWREAGYANLRINVNVSTVQLMRSDYASTVIATAREAGLDPAALTLEVTETQMMRNIKEASSQIALLRAHGVTIALDDFGTGYSTFGSLASLDIDYLKIDRVFVSRMSDARRQGADLVEAITTLAHKFGLKTVAEGVETSEQLQALQRVGCDLFQGFFLGRPVAAAEATELLSSETALAGKSAAGPH